MLLSSVADTMLWTGRYIERANALARAVQGYERLSLDLPGVRSLDLRPLLGLVGRESLGLTELSRDTSALLGALVLDQQNPSSVGGALYRARENLRQGRVVTPPKMWETLNTLYVEISKTDAERVPAVMSLLENVAFACDRIEGELHASMTRDEAYSFLKIGRYLERTDIALRVMFALMPLLTDGRARVFDDVRWLGFLRLAGAHTMYCRRHHANVDPRAVLDFLILDASFPRSVAYGLYTIDRELLRLPRQQRPRDAVQRCIEDASALAAEGAGAVTMQRILGSIEALHGALCRAYFPAEPEPEPEAEASPAQAVSKSRPNIAAEA
jgi:uncharacterized alpha-E superfamily protein